MHFMLHLELLILLVQTSRQDVLTIRNLYYLILDKLSLLSISPTCQGGRAGQDDVTIAFVYKH